MPEPLEIPVEVDATEASRILDDFADDVEELEDKFKPVELDVDASDAERAIDDVRDDLDKLDAEEITPEIRPEVDHDRLNAESRRISDKLEASGAEAGQRFGGSFTVDLGGLVNEKVGQIGDGLVQGIGAGMEAAGVNASLAGPLMAALGIGTVVVAAATTLWEAMNKGAEEYKKKVAEALEVQKSLATGQMTDAVTDLEAKLRPFASTMDQFGLSFEEAGKFILGAESAVTDLTRTMSEEEAWDIATARADELGMSNGELKRKMDEARETLLAMRDANADASGEMYNTQRAMFGLLKATEESEGATEATTDAMLDLAAQTRGPVHNSIIEHIGLVNGIPKSKVTEILTDTDPDDVAQTKRVLDNLTAARSIPVRFAVDVNAADIAAQVRSAVAMAGGTVTATQSVQQYQARNGPIK